MSSVSFMQLPIQNNKDKSLNGQDNEDTLYNNYKHNKSNKANYELFFLRMSILSITETSVLPQYISCKCNNKFNFMIKTKCIGCEI